MAQNYQKKFGLFHNPSVKAEIDRLDAIDDCERIAHLLYCYEFSFDIARGLELAILYTYASRNVAKLLDQTQEFKRHGIKRIEDTAVLIALFIENGWQNPTGLKAIQRINRTHGHYQIANEDFIFVLWTFIHFPIFWCKHYGRRPLSQHEQTAWFNFWIGVATAMEIKDVPPNKIELDAWMKTYQARHFIFDPANKNITEATLNLLKLRLPAVLGNLVEAVALSLMPDPFFNATGYKKPHSAVVKTTQTIYKCIAKVHKYLVFGGYPNLIKNRVLISHKGRYQFENLVPKKLKRIEQNV